MAKRSPRTPDPILNVKARKAPPHEFVLEALAELSPFTRPMFGCLAVYVDEKIVLILRDRPTHTADNGVWIATTRDHHESLRREFPHMRSIAVLAEDVSSWQVLPADAPDFEESAMHACELVIARDSRIGRIPGAKRSRKRKQDGASSVGKRSAQQKSKLRAQSKRRRRH
jgi:hypothetical protein